MLGRGLRAPAPFSLPPMLSSDTIAAVATPRGTGALAIVRVSGSEAIAVVARCFRDRIIGAPSHTAHAGYLSSPTGELLDQVVVTVFRAPSSATGEDVVEVTTHGGDVAPQLVLRALLDAGARVADPGEFTQRAFLNGKLDLAQAEAVADLIHAAAGRAHRTSVAHLRGDYSRLLDALRHELLDPAAYLELELDFSEEDVAFADRTALSALLARAEATLSELLGSYRFGALVRDGVRVAIVGRPNVGKSTLLNALVGYDRAIVSAVPGTTRDEVEAEAEIDGLRFRFTDTAGLRETEDAVEAEGVRRALARAVEADVLLYVFDVIGSLAPAERLFLTAARAARPDVPVLLIANKADLVDTEPDSAGAILCAAKVAGDPGVGAIVRAIGEAARGGVADAEASRIVTNARHRQHLAAALAAVVRARAALSSRVSADLLALDLRVALHELGAITGAITNEHVLDQIFSRFCIGK